jgi:formamidopyrimidine-DNA glycosylase
MLEVLGVPGGDLVARARKFGKKHTVATALLDQRIFCGVGNYIRADACYTAKIDPRLPLSSLDEGELHRLFRSCGEVAAAAYMEPARFVNTCYQRKTSPKGNPIESYVDATGRTMWWCPAEQASPHL